MESEFGFRTHQMRTPYTVKNAWIFEVLEPNKIREVLAHGDINDVDILDLTESGRTFFVFTEDAFQQGWKAYFYENRDISCDNWGDPESQVFSVINTQELETFAWIVVRDGDFKFTKGLRYYRKVG